MQRFTLPRDLYHGKGALEALKTLEGKKAIVCVGGGSMKRNGFLDRACNYLQECLEWKQNYLKVLNQIHQFENCYERCSCYGRI